MPQDTARNRDIIRRRAEGQPYKIIAADAGISVERARQIVEWHLHPRPQTTFRFNTGKRVFMEWITGTKQWWNGKPPTHREVIRYVRGKDIQQCVDAGLVVWTGDEYAATDLGRELLKWRQP